MFASGAVLVMSAMKNTFAVVTLYCVLHFVCCRCEKSDEDDANTNWVPSVTSFASNENNNNNSSSKLWDVDRAIEVEEKALVEPRALLNNFGNSDVFDYERNQLKATPYYHPTSTRDSNSNTYVYSQPINSRPGVSASASYASQNGPTSGSGSAPYPPAQAPEPYQTLQAPVGSPIYVQGQSQGQGQLQSQSQSQGYHYPNPASFNQYLPPSTPASQYLPPVSAPSTQYLPPSQNQVEVFEAFPLGNGNNQTTTNPLEINNINLLYVQPGKCSNSVQVGRVRDVEVKTAGYKYQADTQKGICVLMLYAHDEANKLAVSLQATQGSFDMIPTDSWLQTNVKMYALQAGDLQPVLTMSNFGPGSPALILTKSNIVLLSFFIDRAVDFFVNISTYQSQYC